MARVRHNAVLRPAQEERRGSLGHGKRIRQNPIVIGTPELNRRPDLDEPLGEAIAGAARTAALMRGPWIQAKAGGGSTSRSIAMRHPQSSGCSEQQARWRSESGTAPNRTRAAKPPAEWPKIPMRSRSIRSCAGMHRACRCARPAAAGPRRDEDQRQSRARDRTVGGEFLREQRKLLRDASASLGYQMPTLSGDAPGFGTTTACSSLSRRLRHQQGSLKHKTSLCYRTRETATIAAHPIAEAQGLGGATGSTGGRRLHAPGEHGMAVDGDYVRPEP